MKQSIDNIRSGIEQRNRLRAESGLPLLQADLEVRRRTGTNEKAEFEEYFQKHRHRYEDLWSPKNGRGWLTNSAILATVRRMLRDEMLIERLRASGDA
jgi:hypothetical protein